MAFGWKQYVGHLARESLAHGSRWSQWGRSPRLVIFPCGGRWLGSSNLRAFEIGRALRKRGWRVTVAPPQLELGQRLRILRWEKPDLVLIQKGRHPLNWPKYYPDVPIVFDIDDADYVDDRQRDQVIACCEGSVAVIAGSRYVADWCRAYNPNTSVVWTGTPAPPTRSPIRPEARPPIVTWATSAPVGSPEDGAIVREVVARAAERTSFEFRLYGIPGDGVESTFSAGFHNLPVPVRLIPYMTYDRLLKSLGEVAVGLSPIADDVPFNRGKSFGKVLAYLATDVAVVCSNKLEMPHFFRHGETGLLADTIDEWVEAICRLIEDPSYRQAVADAAHADFVERLSIDAAASQVDRILRAALEGRGVATA